MGAVNGQWLVLPPCTGLPTDKNVFKNSIENLCSLFGGLQAGLAVHTASTDGGSERGPGFGLQELASAARSLLLCLDPDTSPDIQKPWAACPESRGGGWPLGSGYTCSESSNSTPGPEPEQVWEPSTPGPAMNSGDYTHRRIQWVWAWESTICEKDRAWIHSPDGEDREQE